jgi:hypothetical protein
VRITGKQREGEKMKKNFIVFGSCLVFLGLLISGCASIKILTPQEINNDIGGLPNLKMCQFFISKDVTLRFLSDTRQTNIQESGTVIAERRIQRKSVVIASSTPGILQTINNSGVSLKGYDQWQDSRNSNMLTLFILFEDDDDNAIKFTAYYDMANDRFELASDEVVFDGLTYQVTYSGDEMPFLKYKLLERTSEKRETRKATGRRVKN